MNRYFYFFLSVYCLACSLDSVIEFENSVEVEESLNSYVRYIDAEKYSFQIGKETNEDQSDMILRITLHNVKMSLLDTGLTSRAKEVMRVLHANILDQDQYDRYLILFKSHSKQGGNENINGLEMQIKERTISFSNSEFE